ncbi:MAG: hypothetical protein ACK40O_07920 [Allosphingosinicella sp.]
MNDRDLQELAALWQEPDAAEQEALQALAQKVKRKGKLLGYVDAAFFILLAIGLVLAVAARPSPAMLAIAIPMLLATMVVTWKRRTIRQMSKTLETADRKAFLDSSVRIATGNLRRATLSLTFMPVGIILAILFKIAMRNQGRIEDPLGALAQWAVSTRGLVTMAIMAVIVAFLLRSRRRIKAELRRLKALRDDYAEEAIRNEEDAGR